jgi:predicted nuclease of restriction endonuclease-like (RecB) superfamily
MELQVNSQYKEWIKNVSKRFRASQVKAALSVNEEMLRFYFSLGRDIYYWKQNSDLGNEFYAQLSQDLCKVIPDVKSFSPTNLKYMQYFFDLYADPQLKQSNTINLIIGQSGQQVVDHKPNKMTSQQVVDLINETVNSDIFKIPWGHQVQIINKCGKDIKKAMFYVQKTIKYNWSRAVLQNFLATNVYEREGKAITNFQATLPATQSDLAQEITKDPYNFDFLTITESYTEKELKDALMNNIQKFLLELGNGFAFVGREVRIMVGEKEKFLDMLFYNIKLHCYVVLEVKVTDFDSSNMGQLGTYIVAVNHQLKGKEDNPTIGLVVCKNKDNIEAQYALESSSQPVGVSAYELSKLIPDNFKSSLPSIDEIEAELNNN